MASRHTYGDITDDQLDGFMFELHDIVVGYFPILLADEIEQVLRSDGYDLDRYLNERFPLVELILEVATKRGGWDNLVEQAESATSIVNLITMLGVPLEKLPHDPVHSLAIVAGALQRCFKNKELEALYLLGMALALPGDFEDAYKQCLIRLLDILSDLQEKDSIDRVVSICWPGLSCGYVSTSSYVELLAFYELQHQSSEALESETVILRSFPLCVLVASSFVVRGDISRGMAMLEAFLGRGKLDCDWLSRDELSRSAVGVARTAIGQFNNSDEPLKAVLFLEARASVWRAFKSIGCACCMHSDATRLRGFLREWFSLEEADFQSGGSLRRALERGPDACLLNTKEYRTWVFRFFALAGDYANEPLLIAAAIDACLSYEGLSLADAPAHIKQVLNDYAEELADYIREMPKGKLQDIVCFPAEGRSRVKDWLQHAMERWGHSSAVAA
jgi:hypothetical protein